MFNAGLPFIICLPANGNDAVKLMYIALPTSDQRSARSSTNWIPEYNLYRMSIPYELYGIQMSAHVFFNSEKMPFDEKKIYADVDKLGDELSMLSEVKGVSKRYTDLFDVVPETKSSELVFKKNLKISIPEVCVNNIQKYN